MEPNQMLLGTEFEPVFAGDSDKEIKEKMRAWLTMTTQELIKKCREAEINESGGAPVINLPLPLYAESDADHMDVIQSAYRVAAVVIDELRRLDLALLQITPVLYNTEEGEQYPHAYGSHIGWQLAVTTKANEERIMAAMEDNTQALNGVWQSGLHALMRSIIADGANNILATDKEH